MTDVNHWDAWRTDQPEPVYSCPSPAEVVASVLGNSALSGIAIDEDWQKVLLEIARGVLTADEAVSVLKAWVGIPGWQAESARELLNRATARKQRVLQRATERNKDALRRLKDIVRGLDD